MGVSWHSFVPGLGVVLSQGRGAVLVAGGPVLKQTKKGQRSISTWVAGVTFLVTGVTFLVTGVTFLVAGGADLWC